MDIDMESSSDRKLGEPSKKKAGFCQSSKCPLAVCILVAALIATVACVTFLSPGVRYKVPGPEQWWKHTVVYQVYPRSFQDSNDDGIGDLAGVLSRLWYFNYLNVGAIWLSPFYKSPMRDFGYDVSDFYAVDATFGNMTDFDNLIAEAHKRDIKIIIDFVPNHSSNESEWFKNSRNAKSTSDSFWDFYIWSDGKTMPDGSKQPPNNWKSVFDGPAWQWDDTRQAYYYHAFLDSQPDLNYRSQAVREEMKKVLRFWLDKGVDGFRVDAVPHLFELEDQTVDEPAGANNGFDPNLHKYTKNQPEVFEVVREWSEILAEYEENDGKSRFLLAETVGIPDDARKKYYEAGSIPFFFNLIPVNKDPAVCPTTLAQCYFDKIVEQLSVTGSEWPNFVIGNHDNNRIADRIGDDYVDAMNLMLLTLPGTPTSYYGEELGMRNGDYTGDPPKDPYAITSNNPANSRDPERNPMQWNSSKYAGFTNSVTGPWLRITPNTDYMNVNVEVERKDKTSHLELYRRLAELRQGEDFKDVDFDGQVVNNCLLYWRGGVTVFINLGTYPETLNLSDYTGGDVIFSTRLRDSVDVKNLMLEPGEGLILRLK